MSKAPNTALQMAVCGLLLAALLAIISSRSPQQDGKTPTSVATQVTTPTPLPAENVPIYPGAQNVQVRDNTLRNGARETTYRTLATVRQVLSFYKDQLAQKGWSLKWENDPSTSPYDSVNLDSPMLGVEEPVTLAFAWLDNQGTSPYDLFFAVTAQAVGGTNVELGLYRIPNLSQIPLYPGAADVKVTNERGNEYLGYPQQRVTTYLVSASPDRVTDFYKTTLPQYGWEVGGQDYKYTATGDEVSIPGSLGFGWIWGGTEGPVWLAGVMLLVQPLADGQTKVTLTSNGRTNVR